jgi:ribonuclease D
MTSPTETPAQVAQSKQKIAPTKEEMLLLPPFAGLTRDAIFVPTTLAEFMQAAVEINAAGIVGFDTESKPTFAKGEVSEGPHVVQFSTLERAYIFQLCYKECWPIVAELLQSKAVTKVGFSLGSDHGQILAKFGVKVEKVLDMVSVFKRQGYRGTTGVKTAVAIVFAQYFRKSKRISTTNWSMQKLNDSQLLYAANDAYAAIKVFDGLNLAHDVFRVP